MAWWSDSHLTGINMKKEKENNKLKLKMMRERLCLRTEELAEEFLSLMATGDSHPIVLYKLMEWAFEYDPDRYISQQAVCDLFKVKEVKARSIIAGARKKALFESVLIANMRGVGYKMPGLEQETEEAMKTFLRTFDMMKSALKKIEIIQEKPGTIIEVGMKNLMRSAIPTSNDWIEDFSISHQSSPDEVKERIQQIKKQGQLVEDVYEEPIYSQANKHAQMS